MTWQEYFDLQISRGCDPELVSNNIGHLMDLYGSYNWDSYIPFQVD